MRRATAAATTLLCTNALALADLPPKIIPMGCNSDGAPTWLAVGRAATGPEPGSIRVELPHLDLDRVEATVTPTGMDMYMPYAGPAVAPIAVANVTIADREVDGTTRGAVVTVHFNTASANPGDLARAGAIAYVLVLNGKASGCKAIP